MAKRQVFAPLSCFLRAHHPTTCLKICWVIPPPPTNTALIRRAGAQGRTSGGDGRGSSPTSQFPSMFYLGYVLTLRPRLFGNRHQSVRALPRRGQAAPGESQTEEICAQDSVEPRAFLGKHLGKPLNLGCDFLCKGGGDISRHQQSAVRIHSLRSLFLFIALGGGSC